MGSPLQLIETLSLKKQDPSSSPEANLPNTIGSTKRTLDVSKSSMFNFLSNLLPSNKIVS